MYPFLRLVGQIYSARRAPSLELLDEAETHTTVMPWDLDFWNELNNGRTLTLFDLGRIPMAQRIGLLKVMRSRGWGMTVAGSSVRYRRRVQAFAKLKIVSRVTCWDARFFYMEHSMWRSDGECTSHVLIRGAVTSGKGIVPTSQVLDAIKFDPNSPNMPPWITAWVDSEQQRPWPPMSG